MGKRLLQLLAFLILALWPVYIIAGCVTWVCVGKNYGSLLSAYVPNCMIDGKWETDEL